MTGPSWAGVIAAGEGSRLRASHPGPKPLVEVGGKPLVHWVVLSLKRAGVRSLTFLHNSSGDAVRAYLKGAFPDLSWTFLRRDTASSWESFRLVAGALAPRTDRFLMSTTDAIVPPADAARFAAEAFAPLAGGAPDAALALTRFVDDEKPLWADLSPEGRVTALGDRARRRDAVTCGLYALTGAQASRMPAACAHARLRDYWSSLLTEGAAVRGVLLSDTVDVDRPEDLPAAEKVTLCFER